MNPPSFADIWTYEVFLNLSSYLPLSEVEIAGGARGVKFVFKKSSSIA